MDPAVASEQSGKRPPSITDQVETDVSEPIVLERSAFRGGGGHFEHSFRNGWFRQPRIPRHRFHGLAVFVAGLKIHLRVGPGRILAQKELDPAGRLEDFSPIQQRKQPQAGERVPNGYLVFGLPVLFAQGQFTERLRQNAFEPMLNQRHRVGLVV